MLELKKELVIFTPDAFPALLKWTTYPINAAQKLLYNRYLELFPTERYVAKSENASRRALQHYYLEILSFCDRCTAVGYTGSAKVLLRQLGTIFWFGSAIQGGLLPCFNPKLLEFSCGEDSREVVKVATRLWPIDTQTKRPLQSSSRSHEIEFGSTFKEVC